MLRRGIRALHKDVRMNTRVGKDVLRLVREMKVPPMGAGEVVASKRHGAAGSSKRKRKVEESEDESSEEEDGEEEDELEMLRVALITDATRDWIQFRFLVDSWEDRTLGEMSRESWSLTRRWPSGIANGHIMDWE